MSQQEMEFGNVQQDGPKSTYGGYDGNPQYSNSYAGAYGQKIATSSGPSWGQRLALAIVSLALLIVLLVIEIISVQGGPSNFSFTALKVIAVCILFAIFSAVVIVINYFFNCKH